MGAGGVSTGATARGSPLRVLAAAMLLSAVLFPAGLAAAAPSLSLSPSSGERGESFQISGSGFPARALVTVTWDGVVPLAVAPADDSGSFTARGKVPKLASAGNHEVVATAITHHASATFTVVTGDDTTTSTVTTTTVTTTTTPVTTTTVTTTLPTTTTTASTTSTTSTTRPTTTSTTSTTRPTTTTTPPGPTTTATTGSTTTTPIPTGEQVPTPPSPPPATSTAPGTPGDEGNDGTSDRPLETQDATSSTESSSDVAATASSSTVPEGSASSDADANAEGGELVFGLGHLGLVPFLAAEPDGGQQPQLNGLSPAPGVLSVDPQAAGTGASVEISLSLEEPVGGFFSVVFQLGDTPLGEPVPGYGEEITASRIVPIMRPGSYVITAWGPDRLLARTDFEILDPRPRPDPLEGIVLGLLVATLVALSWAAVRSLRPLRASRRK